MIILNQLLLVLSGVGVGGSKVETMAVTQATPKLIPRQGIKKAVIFPTLIGNASLRIIGAADLLIYQSKIEG